MKMKVTSEPLAISIPSGTKSIKFHSAESSIPINYPHDRLIVCLNTIIYDKKIKIGEEFTTKTTRLTKYISFDGLEFDNNGIIQIPKDFDTAYLFVLISYNYADGAIWNNPTLLAYEFI
jgi:hypothetical protein